VSGSEFQICEAAAGKYQPLMVESLRYVQAISAGRAECSSTRYVSDTSEWSQVSRRGIVKNFVAEYCNLILYALRDPQPVKADECVGDVVGAFQIEDQPCRCIQNRLESTHLTCNSECSVVHGTHCLVGVGGGILICASMAVLASTRPR